MAWGWWSKTVRTAAQTWFFGRLGDPAMPAPPVAPDQRYVNVFLRSMHVANLRVGAITYHGSVTSSFSMLRRSGTSAEFLVIVTPNMLKNIDPAGLDKVVTLNTRLVGPLPYRGGDVNAEIGLFSVPQSDLAEPYLSIVEQLTGLAGVSLASSSMPLVRTVKSALNMLVGAASDTRLEIGVRTSLTPLVEGDYCAVKLSAADLTPADLRLTPAGTLTSPNGADITAPYLVFTVSTSPVREDWFIIPEIRAAYDELRAAARRGDLQRAEEGVRAFRRVATTCDDLLAPDGVRLTDLVQTEINLAFGEGVLTSATPTRDLPDLAALPLFAAATPA
jgi:hypothetical protein